MNVGRILPFALDICRAILPGNTLAGKLTFRPSGLVQQHGNDSLFAYTRGGHPEEKRAEHLLLDLSLSETVPQSNACVSCGLASLSQKREWILAYHRKHAHPVATSSIKGAGDPLEASFSVEERTGRPDSA